MPNVVTDKTDTKGAVEGREALEYITEMLSESYMIPGITCTVDMLSKQITKKYRRVKAAKAKTVGLFEDGDKTGNATTETVKLEIDNRLQATISGEFMPHFTDPEFDTELWNDVKEQIILEGNANFVNLIKTKGFAGSTETYTKENVIDMIIDAKTAYTKANKKAPVKTLLVSSEVLGMIEKLTYFVPNNNAVGLTDQAVKGNIKGMNVVEVTELDDEDIAAVVINPKEIRFLLINPVTKSVVPGMDEVLDNGFIVRTEKPINNITKTTALHMPFGLGVIGKKTIMKDGVLATTEVEG